MRIDPNICRDPDLLAAEVRRLRAVIEASHPDRLAELQRLTELDEETERTPPGECALPREWLQRPYYVDPPSGWAYGFPKLYDPATDGDMTEWLIREGYPERLAKLNLPCTFTAQE